MPKPKKLTTTSYAVLAHLAVQPWSAFDLANQMTRGMDLIWPRAVSGIYEEPKNLLAYGLAQAHATPSEKGRGKTVYSITQKGRRELREWLSQPTGPQQLESEPLVRLFFAERGSKEDLQATLAALGRQGKAVRERMTLQVDGYLRDGGPFSERWHLIALGAQFLSEYGSLCERFAARAGQEVRSWNSLAPVAARDRKLLERIVKRQRK